MKKPATPKPRAKSAAQTALSALERAAAKGNEAAQGKLAEVFALLTTAKPKAKRGRKVGSPTVYCMEGAPMNENESRARYGKGSVFVSAPEVAAAGIVHQVGTLLTPPPPEAAFRWLDAPPEPPQPDTPRQTEARRARALSLLQRDAAPKILAAIESGNVALFENFAEAVRNRSAASIKPHSAQHAALLAYVRPMLDKNPLRKFTNEDFRAGVKWPKGSGVPDDRQLKRLIAKVGIPMQRGAPRKNSSKK